MIGRWDVLAFLGLTLAVINDIVDWIGAHATYLLGFAVTVVSIYKIVEQTKLAKTQRKLEEEKRETEELEQKEAELRIKIEEQHLEQEKLKTEKLKIN